MVRGLICNGEEHMGDSKCNGKSHWRVQERNVHALIYISDFTQEAMWKVD